MGKLVIREIDKSPWLETVKYICPAHPTSRVLGIPGWNYWCGKCATVLKPHQLYDGRKLT